MLVVVRPIASVMVTVKAYAPALIKVAVVFFAAFVPLALKGHRGGGVPSGGPGVLEAGFAAGRVSPEDGEQSGGAGHGTGVRGRDDGRIDELPDFRGRKGPADDAEVIDASEERRIGSVLGVAEVVLRGGTEAAGRKVILEFVPTTTPFT